MSNKICKMIDCEFMPVGSSDYCIKHVCAGKDCVLPADENSNYCQGCNALGRGDNWIKQTGLKKGRTNGMGGVSKKPRNCKACGGLYHPSGNRQQKCDTCRGKKTAGNASGKSDTKAVDRILKGGVSATRANVKRPGGPIQLPVGGVTLTDDPTSIPTLDYKLTVDFTSHMDIYRRIVELAEQEIRPPEMQLLFMCREEFQKADKNE